MFNKLVLLTFIFLHLAACSYNPAIQRNKELNEITASVENFFSASNTLDAEQWAQYFNSPLTLVVGQGININIVKDDFVPFFLPIINYLENEEFSHIEWKNLQVRKLGNDIAMASAIISQMDVQDQVIDRFGEIYMLSKDGDKWKISTITRFSPEQYVQF